MAVSISFKSISHEETNLQALQKCLEDEYNMPPSGWWDEADSKFEELQTFLERRPIDELTSDESLEVDPYIMAAHLARVAVIPIVKLHKAGTFLSRLTATNEPLPCAAFGSISTQSYIDTFWETVAENSSVTVYEFDDSTGASTVRLGKHDFKLYYFQCNDLVRSFADVLSTPSSFLEDPNNCTEDICRMIKGLQRRVNENQMFDRYELRSAYFYLRAWALCRGFLSNNSISTSVLTAPVLIDHLLDSVIHLECLPSTQAVDIKERGIFLSKIILDVISKLVNSPIGSRPLLTSRVQPFPEDEAHNLLEILEKLQSEPLHRFMNFPHYLKVDVIWNGSGIKGLAWLRFVERRLARLNEQISRKFSTSSIQIHISIWPQRLIPFTQAQQSSDRPSDIYEASYIVGFQLPSNSTDLPQIIDLATKWNFKDSTYDDDTASIEGYITVLYVPASDFTPQRFIPCTREWPQEPIIRDPESNFRRTSALPRPKAEKPKKAKNGTITFFKETEGNPSQETKKLRPAADVLSRLKYDRTLNIDEWKVGYRDRHSERLLEKPASNWVGETTHEEWIPEHRVEYFKRYAYGNLGYGKEGEIMWSKKERVDKIFS